MLDLNTVLQPPSVAIYQPAEQTNAGAQKRYAGRLRVVPSRGIFTATVDLREVFNLTERDISSTEERLETSETPVSAGDYWERVFSDLGSLVGDEETIAPSQSAISDAEFVSTLLPQRTRPEVEIDDSCGFISFRWFEAGTTELLTMTFPGRGKVLISIVPQAGERAITWSLPARAERLLARLVDTEQVQRFFHV